MRVGIDIDDTICNTFEYILPYACEFYKLNYEKLKKEPISYSYFTKNYDDFYVFAKEFYCKIVPNIPLNKGVIKYLKKIKALGHEIVFVTARGKLGYDNPYQISYDYLVKNNVPFDALIVDAQDKGQVCLDEKIDLFFDDDINNYRSVELRGIDVYLLTIKANKKYQDVKRVKHFKQIYKIVKGRSNGRR